jgi:hypothetical protein
VRTVDAVVGARDLTLQTAEALEALAPFGRGNPPVRLVLPGAELESPARVGQGRHLQVRLRSGGVNARAIGFRMGEKAAGIALDERHDALISLEIERWQGLVGPRVAVDALHRIPSRDVLPGGCPQACDIACPDRVGGDDLRSLVLDGDDDPGGLAGPPPPPAAGPPAGVRDRRGQGASLAVLASLAGADRGAVAVVADVARRRGALETALEPGRLGLEVAVLAGGRCDPGAMAARIALARGVPALLMVEYARLPEVELPEGMHMVLVDPPASPEDAAWAAARAAGRWLHLTWGEAETGLALDVAEEEWELRPAAAAVWTGLRDGVHRAWGLELDRVLLGDGPAVRQPRAAARALRVLAEVGLVEVGEDGVRAAPDPARRDLAASALYRACRDRLTEVRAHLSRSATLDLLARAEVPERALAG